MIFFYVALLVLLLSWTYFSQKLTLAGTLTAGSVAIAIYLGAGLTGIALLGTFFFLGTAATAWKKDKKVKQRLVEGESSRRTAGQVLANGGVAAVLGLLAWLWPQHSRLLLIMMAGAFSAATADTLSSELGMLYGRRFYNIRTLQPDKRGLDGVVSMEGTLLGMAGSVLVGLCLMQQPVFSLGMLLVIVAAGTVGNFTDSWLGATLERKAQIGNNAVNTLNTVAGAVSAGLLWWAWT